MYGYWIATNYRESYGMYPCNGIVFNHESSRSGEIFVTHKITRGLSNIALGLEDCLYDWGPRQGLRAHAVDDAPAGASENLRIVSRQYRNSSGVRRQTR